MTVSNATHVTLRNVGFNLSGNFTCEVTADAPSFYTGVATNVLTVVGKCIRTEPPQIIVLQTGSIDLHRASWCALLITPNESLI
ncbi:hypothetical protein AND_001699 [Anopheles darlingi]|uniref:Uncharacterized protein n=1 Tax=Anopheles darlingi TaxID=43151 RepID=W5JQ46_ANODA|nr:hypothetical protein AND_001699 [Anopheles darlingi]